MPFDLVIIFAVCIAGQPCVDHRQSVSLPDYANCAATRRDMMSRAYGDNNASTAVAFCMPSAKPEPVK